MICILNLYYSGELSMLAGPGCEISNLFLMELMNLIEVL